ncbi:patatin-like phospholipase family protein [Crenobacter cavernae]|uniref:Patatin-like phospholipase family protein n=1 Tax=Crenobacter cavernae TaxID=2290923 RepID=A0A345Y8Z5_9NEIS|nr:patatin-like phospholipase family protein [Crenobacter cavernae]AXK40397.1 patatin-like phospholipase family protein [Crenobacter cavernae]
MAERQKSGAGDKKAEGKPKVALVLQGGGALGAYHIGAYEAMEQAGFQPDWVAGISIGAINAAVIASNPPDKRLTQLERLWDDISRPDESGTLLSGPLLRWYNQFNVAEAMVLGQPNFWSPRLPSPLLVQSAPPDKTSFYDTTPMLGTLRDVADFDRLNEGKSARLSLGATRVDTGELVFFDSARQALGPRHVLASGSLPPGFPATEVDGHYYWDGGCVSNTPLNAILDDEDDSDLLVFMIDLWSAKGSLPSTMDEVAWRQKQIQYASRSSQVEALCAQHNLRAALAASPDTEAVGEGAALRVKQRRVDIVHITYQPTADQSSFSDAEFSRSSIAKRRDAGFQDMRHALQQAPWTRSEGQGAAKAVLHKVRGGEVSSHVPR